MHTWQFCVRVSIDQNTCCMENTNELYVNAVCLNRPNCMFRPGPLHMGLWIAMWSQWGKSMALQIHEGLDRELLYCQYWSEAWDGKGRGDCLLETAESQRSKVNRQEPGKDEKEVVPEPRERSQGSHTTDRRCPAWAWGGELEGREEHSAHRAFGPTSLQPPRSPRQEAHIHPKMPPWSYPPATSWCAQGMTMCVPPCNHNSLCLHRPFPGLDV